MSMKQNTTNTFDKGLNLDLHPIVTPNSVLTDNLNGTFITYNGNEFCLQNDRGNKKVASLSNGFIPIGAKEYNGIIYIVSVNQENAIITETDETTGKSISYIDPALCVTEIGTYPGVDWTRIDYDDEPEGKLLYDEYRPLGNFYNGQTQEFRTSGLNYTTINPVTIEIEPSYDGSVNLIITDDVNPVRLINTAFSVLPNDKYKLIKRNQEVPTNYYSFNKLEDLTLIRTTNVLTNVNLVSVQSGGQLKGGNYIFYIKFGDSDYNQTDVVAESGIVSIFKGNDCIPSTISGTVLDERTDKMICLDIEGLNKIYSKIYIYYCREYSDTQGYRMTEYGVLKDPIDMDSDTDVQRIWISGYEQIESIDKTQINIDYHTFDSARTETQQQDMLFLGNLKITETNKLYQQLKNITETVESTIKQHDPMGTVNFKYNANTSSDEYNSEYYSTQNIYNYVGYWPNEWYRFGIVYVLKDGATTPVFNMPGGWFEETESGWKLNKWEKEEEKATGVFKTPDIKIFNEDKIQPIYFEFKLSGTLPKDVIGYFYVRQKRIPTTICQGVSLGIDTRSHLPVTWNGKKWITQSFLSLNRFDYNVGENCNWSGEGAAARRLDLKPILQYTSTKSTNEDIEEDTIQTGDYSLRVQEILQFVEVVTYNSYEDFQNNVSTYDTNTTRLESTTPIYVYKFQRVYHYSTTSNNADGYNTWTPPGTSAPIKYCYYATLDELTNTNNLLWFTNQFYGWAAWDYYSENALIRARTHNYGYDINPTTESSKYSVDFDNKYIMYPPSYGSNKIAELALLSLDPCVNSSVRNILDGSEFDLVKEYSTNTFFGKSDTNEKLKGTFENDEITHIWEKNKPLIEESSLTGKCVFVPADTKVKEMDGFTFSNVAGSRDDVSQYSYAVFGFGITNNYKDHRGDNNDGDAYRYLDLGDFYNTIVEKNYTRCSLTGKVGFNSVLNVNIIRGLFTPFIGTNKLLSHGLWSIRIKDKADANSLLIRQQDESPYYTVSERTDLETTNVYRGDCFTNTVSMRIIRNFIDPDVPVSDNIVDFDGWDINVRRWGDRNKSDNSDTGDNKMENILWDKVNRADVNTVDLGYWVSYKCLSSSNLGLRSEDSFHTEEMSLLGSPRSFYPLNGGSIATGNKIQESFLLNDGYSATVGEKEFNLIPDTPYSKSEFANRIIFSNVQVDDAFTNGYRIFQGLSYQDYDKQYGEIVKLVPWENNLLCVMEHGIGLIGVNEQALMQTNTADTIHIYGHGVLSDKMQIISPDYGSKYEHSVVRTPIGVYGIDTDARKIWRVGPNGFETLSDMKIESYLNDEMGTNKSVDLPLFDVRTHYNATKGDLMFTFFKKLFKTKPVEQLEPRTTITPIDEKYFNINTSDLVLSIGESITRKFNTNLSELEVSFNVDISGIVNAELDFANKTLTITGLEAGETQIEIGEKMIEVRVKTAEEEYADRQRRTAQRTGTGIVSETVSEIDPETGEQVERVVSTAASNIVITSTGHNSTLYVGEIYPITVNFRNNNLGITLDDCEITYEFKDGGNATFSKQGNKLLITPTSAGKMRYGVHYNKLSGFDEDWLTLVNKKFYVLINGRHENGETVDVSTAEGTYFEVLAYRENYGEVTFTGFDENIVEICDRSEGMKNITILGKQPGDTTMIVTDTATGEFVTVNLHVVNHIDINDAEFYSGGEKIESLTMREGEQKSISWKYLPSNYTGNVNVISVGLGKDKPDVFDMDKVGKFQVARASITFGSRSAVITALKKGTIVFHVDISEPVEVSGKVVKLVELPITVIDE